MNNKFRDWSYSMRNNSQVSHLQIQSRNATTRRQSKGKHIPIFANRNTSQTHYRNNNNTIANIRLTHQGHVPIFRNNKNYSQVINYDYCGCENKMSPCFTIQQTFLSNVSLKDMKDAYLEQLEKTQINLSTVINSQSRKALFRILPRQYPQIYFTHLNNLIQVIGINQIGQAQFQCLLAIQYHSKYEYLTYYLFKDLKKSFQNLKKFKDQIQLQLLRFNTSIFQLRYQYNQKLLGDQLDNFLNNYYESVGANFIPITRYAKFIQILYKKGPVVLVKFIVNFMVNKRIQMENGLKYLKSGDTQYYLNFMRELNFEEFIDNIV